MSVLVETVKSADRAGVGLVTPTTVRVTQSPPLMLNPDGRGMTAPLSGAPQPGLLGGLPVG